MNDNWVGITTEIWKPEYRVSRICCDERDNIIIIFKNLTSVQNVLGVCSFLNVNVKNATIYAESNELRLYIPPMAIQY